MERTESMHTQSIHMPNLQEGLLDEAHLRQLLFDIELQGSALEIQVKGQPGQRAQSADGSLAQLYGSLMAGSVVAVQLRYVHAQRAWCDTIMATSGGFRLIRVDLDQVAALPVD